MMATVWNLTFTEFVTRVLQKLGVVGVDETVSGEDFSLASDVVDGSLKALHGDGLLWWAVTTTPIAWAGGATQTAPTGYASVVEAYWLDGTYWPVRVVERGEYEAIPDRTYTGRPEVLFDDDGTLTLWPAPGAGTLRLTYQREIADVSGASTMDIPKGMVKPLIDMMAYELAPYFGVQNPRIEADAARAMDSLAKFRRQVAQPGPVAVDYF